MTKLYMCKYTFIFKRCIDNPSDCTNIALSHTSKQLCENFLKVLWMEYSCTDVGAASNLTYRICTLVALNDRHTHTHIIYLQFCSFVVTKFKHLSKVDIVHTSRVTLFGSSVIIFIVSMLQT